MTLPRSWHMCVLGDALEVVSGFAFKSTDYKQAGHFLVRIGNVQQGKIELGNPVYVQISSFTRKFELKSGDILTSLTGNIGRVARVREEHLPAALNQRVARLEFKKEIVDDSYLFSFLSSAIFRDKLALQGQGAAQQNVSPKAIAAIPFPFPPLAEQRRIVAKLDALNAHITRARAELGRIPKLANRLRLQALSDSFEGAVSSRCRQSSTLAQYCSSISDGDHQAPPRAEVGIPFITISAMNAGYLDLKKVTRFVPESYFKSLAGHRRAKVGDVLYSVTGSFGISAKVCENSPFVFQRHIALLRPKIDACSPKWLWYILKSPQVLRQARDIATGTAQLTVPLTGLRNLTLPQLSLSEQIKAVELLDSAFVRAERLEAEAIRAQALLDRLELALLGKAFRGELVPQHSADEPALVLLERIRAEWAAAPARKRMGASKTRSPAE